MKVVKRMQNKKLSVIIAVYNTEQYIKKCLDSLLHQTYQNIELVVVNDGSTDSSLTILNEYATRYDKLILINNEKNRGLSYSRNIGLEKATGFYIGYIDSDDYVEEHYYENMIQKMETEQADMAITDIKVVYEDASMPDYITKGCEGKPTKLNFIYNGLAASACNKVFQKSLIAKYKFAEGKVNEDLAVILPAIVSAKKIVYVPDNFYYYIQRNGSIQNSGFSNKRFDIFYGVDLTLERIKGCKNYQEIADAIIYMQLITLLIYVIPKEKNLIKRYKILHKYSQLASKYHINQNQYFIAFLNEQGKKKSIYYKMLIQLNCMHMNFFSNCLILLYDIARYLLKPKDFKTDICLQDLKKLAYHQSRKKEKVSITAIIPNYNYKRFLYQRLYSILYQTEKVSELVILDDDSTDGSRELIDEVIKALDGIIPIQKCYNNKNSGSPFKQWEKGMHLSKSQYVWIAEADDYCSKHMLKKLVKPILQEDGIVISYADTAFIDIAGNKLIASIVPEIDIQKTGHWNRNYINDGKEEFKRYTYLNCTIANVSSALIKKDDYKKEFATAGQYHQAGDWVFYANIMQKGKIAYTAQPLNWYRIHGDNVTSTTRKEKHMEEIQKIHQFYNEMYELDVIQKEQIRKRYAFLEKAWKLEVKNEKNNKKNNTLFHSK